MTDANPYQYTIGIVAKRTQIHPETLRVWERRYGLIVPGRSESGRRLYAEADITKLVLVKQLTDRGYPVSGLAQLSIDDLSKQLQTAQTIPSLGAHPPPEQCRLVFASPSLRQRVARDLLLHQDIHIMADWHPSAPSPGPATADVLVLELAALTPDSLALIQLDMAHAGCSTALVVFNFGNKKTIAALEQAGVICLKGLVTAADIHRASLFARQRAARTTPAIEQTVTPRRFSNEQLARVTGLTSTIACECPNHLAELITNLSAFELYSSECANRDAKDAQLHQQLNQSAGKARAILEESLARLMDIEGIVV
jgi:DNA-binding transcriptional MerR regulator